MRVNWSVRSNASVQKYPLLPIDSLEHVVDQSVITSHPCRLSQLLASSMVTLGLRAQIGFIITLECVATEDFLTCNELSHSPENVIKSLFAQPFFCETIHMLTFFFTLHVQYVDVLADFIDQLF